MSSERDIYRIGGKNFWQGPLVLGQVEHLLPLVDGLTFSSGNAEDLAKALGPRLYQALACVLIEDGQQPGDLVDLLDQGKLEERAIFFRKNIAWNVAAEVVSSFFSCNPITSMSGLLAKFNRAVTGDLASASKPITPSSAEATLPSGAASAAN